MTVGSNCPGVKFKRQVLTTVPSLCTATIWLGCVNSSFANICDIRERSHVTGHRWHLKFPPKAASTPVSRTDRVWTQLWLCTQTVYIHPNQHRHWELHLVHFWLDSGLYYILIPSNEGYSPGRKTVHKTVLLWLILPKISPSQLQQLGETLPVNMANSNSQFPYLLEREDWLYKIPI